ncbi:MAG: hypothetical protein JNL67_05765 [Planctomycetaceae bacterium]|nr:hypothetical protein [Planctomycetaceae bacterium]
MRGFGLGFRTPYFEHSVAPTGYANFLDRMLKPYEPAPFTWMTAPQTPDSIVFQPIGSCNQQSVRQSDVSVFALGVA